MKRLNIAVKIVFSIIPIGSWVYAVGSFFLNNPSFNLSQELHFIIMGLNAIVILFLILRLSKFRSLSSEQKFLWVLALIFFSPVIVYYILFAEDRLVEQHNHK